jgi:hypothetical protein
MISFIYSRKIDSSIFFLVCCIILGSLGSARSAQQNIGSSVASARSAHLNLFVEFRREHVRRAHQDSLQT